MYKVKVDMPCSCFLKFGLEEIKEFDSLEKAKNYSFEISRFANSSFCHTHFYSPDELVNDEINVKVRLKKRNR